MRMLFDLPLPSRTPLVQPAFLPTTRAEMDALDWAELDVLLVTGDAYVDHPSFGVPLLGRWLVAHGYRTGIIAQPRWRGDDAIRDITRMGRPRLFAGVSAGAIDSMLAHTTAFRKKRHNDAYTAGGKAGARPDRAVLVYADLLRRAFAGLPIAAGGIEASLRRVTHYDFWSDSLRRSIILDGGLDVLMCGMGERAILEIAKRLDAVDELVGGLHTLRGAVSDPHHVPELWPHLWTGIRGVASARPLDQMPALQETELAQHGLHGSPYPSYSDKPSYSSYSPEKTSYSPEPSDLSNPSQHARASEHTHSARKGHTSEPANNAHNARDARTSGDSIAALSRPEDSLLWLPAHETMLRQPKAFLDGSILMERASHQMRHPLAQVCGDRVIVVERPATPLSGDELDQLYNLPFSRAPHPSYTEAIPAVEMIATSITTHRGCGGGCSFCSLALHQGRRIASRSRDSILAEAARIATMPRGHAISDVGGPTANMWGARCTLDATRCRRDSCLFPSICKGFQVDQRACIDLLRQVQGTQGVKHVRVASGVRFDLALKDATALAAYTGEFTGGQLKVAPEHCVPDVLNLMRKPGMKPFESFLQAFYRHSEAHGKEQYVIPYLMSAFPGCTDDHMRELSRWLAERHWSPRQVQCFIPTPGTVATAMYYARCAPDGTPIPVARSDAERRRQHDLLLHPSGNAPKGTFDKREPRTRLESHEPKAQSGKRQHATKQGATQGRRAYARRTH